MPNVLVNHISQQPSGRVFGAADFLKLAHRNTIDQTLLRLAKKKAILKVGVGLYCNPIKNPVLGIIPPSVDDLVRAYAHKLGYQIQIHPAKAANLLGLSLQVPAQHIYLTDGPSRSLVFGGTPVTLKHVCPRKLLGIGTKAGLVIQALYYYGKAGITNKITSKVRSILDDQDRDHLHHWVAHMPAWMQDILVQDVLNV